MTFIKANAPLLLLILAVFVVLQFFVLMALSGRVNRLSRVLRNVMTGPGGEDLEAMLKTAMTVSRQTLERSDELEARLESLQTQMRDCVQNIGLIRYDAYGDVSGSQSFSLALLDDHRNGVIISGLLGRNDGRCYGKPVLQGQTEQTLSEEEESALHIALNGGLGALPDAFPEKRTSRRERREKGMLHRA